MFCKWCGETLKTIDDKCPNCGRETPPLSDCGGFYNLKVTPESLVSGSVSGSVSVPRIQQCPFADEQALRNLRGEKKKKESRVIPVIGFAIVSMVLIVTIIGGLWNYGKWGKIQDALQELQAAALEQGQNMVSDPTPDQHKEETAIVLAKQNVEIAIEVYGAETGMGIAESVDLGRYTGVVVATCQTDAESSALTSASFQLEDGTELMEVQIEKTDLPDENVITLTYQVNAEEFGEFSEISCLWQYRTGKDFKWLNLDDRFIQSNSEGATRVSFKPNNLKDLFIEDSRVLEWRCVIDRENKDQGSLQIVIEGIR